MNVVLWRRLAGVGHETVVGVCPVCWGNDEMPLPGDDTLPETDIPLLGSGLSFLKAPSAVIRWMKIENQVNLQFIDSELSAI